MKLKILFSIIGITTGIALVNCMGTDVPAVNNSESTMADRIEGSPQYKEGKFNDMGNTLNMSFSDIVVTTWDFIFAKNNRTPDEELPVKPVDLSHFNGKAMDQLNATWLGHSSLMINMDGYKVLTDPVFEKRVSILGPTRFNGDVPLDIQKIPPIDIVIISHDHYDHLNKYSVKRIAEKTNKFIVPLKVGDRLVDWGVARDKIVELDWWQEYAFDRNLMIAATPAQHFSGRGITDRNKTLWASWVVKTPHHKIFFSGDSGYFGGFKQIGETYGPFDMTFIECGAYGEGWPKVHMFPEQTAQAHLDLKGNVLHPIHWGTFNLALHPWYEPMERLTAAANLNQIEIATPVVGETTVYDMKIPTARWWKQPMQLSGGLVKTADSVAYRE
jgi:L-ascorbate metabolism protein UlaG (beta-lactamase superfamily)